MPTTAAPPTHPPSADAQARLLLLIDVFSGAKGIEGRMKLAKLDFLLRYPDHFNRLMAVRRPGVDAGENPWLTGTIEQSMIRYKYGPWDPTYYSLLGALTGKGLIEPRHEDAIATYCTTPTGHDVAHALTQSESWRPVYDRAVLLRRHFNLTGTTLKNLIYETFSDIVEADWGTHL
ncbi:hypothetical protein [Streptomyces sp. NPDC088748]|uniref:hypothetical protein n=1 Tax=Streptomyces sp. NPDC088748 TaxID=3365887 RepID=UPI00381CF93C